jgi:hypothetical protein
MSLTHSHVIVWDLDLTLGDFSALNCIGDPAGPVTVKVRPGLERTLRKLSEAGFTHTLLTLASPLYAEMALRGAGIRPFFVRVEGLGQRYKGDAAGIAGALGIPENDLPHRMVFVGDHPIFDAPQDPRILFHLEPMALSRPARDLRRLIVHLRDSGNGSFRQGFDRVARQRTGWRRLWPFQPPLRSDTPVRRSLAGVGDVLLLAGGERCPVIAFKDPPALCEEPSVHTFDAGEMIAQIVALQAQARP